MPEPHQTAIILPLYIYPAPGAWEPLYGSLHRYPTLNFTIIVNPNSGPGAPPWWPNEDYVREIARLNALPNVHTVGYVRTDYCRRPITEVHEDIATYADWSKDRRHPGLNVQGIFFDETPNVYSAHAERYLSEISANVKNSCGILGRKLVIHNPGTAADARLTNVGSDVTVVVEESCKRFTTKEYQNWLSTSRCTPEQSAYMVHSVPDGIMAELIEKLRGKGRYLFVTDLKEDYYSKFGKTWGNFVAMVANDRSCQ